MVACIVFKTGKYIKAFTFDPQTFIFANVEDIKLPGSGMESDTHYATLLNPLDQWFQTHARGTKLYYDGPKIVGEQCYINKQPVPLDMLPKNDSKNYAKMLVRLKRLLNFDYEYRDTHVKKVRESVNEGKPILECLLNTSDKDFVRMAFCASRDRYHEDDGGRGGKPSYQKTFQRLDAESEWEIITESIRYVLPEAQRNRLGLTTLKKAAKAWNFPKGSLVARKEDLRLNDNEKFKIFDDVFNKVA